MPSGFFLFLFAVAVSVSIAVAIAVTVTIAVTGGHLDANAKSEAGRAIESVLSINSESED